MTTTQTSRCSVRLDGEDGDASIETFELVSARRALRLLKAKLGREGLLDLLREEIEAGDAFLREQVQRAEGRELTGTTVLRAHGIVVPQFTAWLSRAFGREDVLLAGHPEHYSIHNGADGSVNVVETLGEHVCSMFLTPWDDSEVPPSGPQPPAGGSTSARRTRLALEDGTVFGSVSTAFEPDEGGFLARLTVTLPDNCAPLVEQHLEHFAVEFHTWILRAAQELATSTESASGPAGRAADDEPALART